MININEIKKALENRNDRSAWNKGVTGYALELPDGLQYSASAEYIEKTFFDAGEL